MAANSQKGARTALAVEIGIIVVCLIALAVILLPGEDRINELPIIPDTVEYGTGAANFAETGEYFIWVGKRRYPPMYPFGFALFQYPFLKITGAEPGNVRYGLIAAAIAAVMLLYVVTRSLAGRLAGAVAAALLAASPAVAIYGRIPMAETPFVFIMVAELALGLAVLSVRRIWLRDLCLVGMGVLVGLGTAIRLNAVLFILPAAALIVIASRRRGKKEKKPARLLLNAGFLFAGFAPFALAVCVYNRSHYGSYTRAGYAYWASYLHDDPGKVWRAEYAFKGSYNRAGVSNLAFSIKSLFALASPRKYRVFKWVWIPVTAILALAVFGALSLFRRRAGPEGKKAPDANAMQAPGGNGKPKAGAWAWLALVAGTNFLLTVIMLFYFYQDGRFHLSWLPIVFLFAGIGVSEMIKLLDNSGRPGKVKIVVFCAVGLLGLVYVFATVSQAVKFTFFDTPQIKTVRAYRERAEMDAVIISDMYGPYISYWLIKDTKREHVPYSWGRARQYVMPEKPARTPRAEYVWAFQLLPKSGQKDRASGILVDEVFPGTAGPDSLDEAVALGAEPLYRYAAATSPGRIREFLLAGRPVYMDTVWIYRILKDISEEVLERKKKEIEEILGLELEEVSRPAGRPLYRLHLR